MADRVPRAIAELLETPQLALELDPGTAASALVRLAPVMELLRIAASAPPANESGSRPVDESPAREGDTLLTPEEVALALGVEVGAVARLCRRFRRKLGHRTYRYLKRDIDAFVRGRA